MPMTNCKVCVFYVPKTTADTFGACRLHAPVIVFGTHEGTLIDNTEYPVVDEKDGCGDGEAI